ncbi:MAG: (deoxy)nucleoside triphosphate pyrophosphohydrolase [Tenericutes bacterium]|nr:(deoxy)nucleoside triphosphate pyrophosphohydrolase [Mycoplasmatota bacterium]
MKDIEVVAAVIQDGDKILATRRGYGDFIGMWEFPGGKIEGNETQEEALVREIKEELDADIELEEFITTVNYDYPNFHLIMHCYLCHLKENKIILVEHSDAKWLTKDKLSSVDWLPADIEVVEKLKKLVR